MITKVTFTGPDERTDPKVLFDLQKKFPWVEWGILFSRSSTGNSKRFPSLKWIKRLVEEQSVTPIRLNLALHLCGEYVSEILKGNTSFLWDLDNKIWQMIERVQINTHGVPHDCNIHYFTSVLNHFPNRKFILQYDNKNVAILNQAILKTNNVETLFDLSHGEGVLPDQWPQPLHSIKCGYAGGLSPENIEKQIKAIEKVAWKEGIWIDMETGVREDNWFDISKVEAVLNICKEYIQQ